MSAIDSPRQAVARTDAEWTELWRAHHPDRPRPAVDLSKEMIVAVFLGTRPTGGFSVDITGVTDRNGAIVVSYRESAPGRDAIATQVLTSPYHIVAVPTRAGEVKFTKIT